MKSIIQKYPENFPEPYYQYGWPSGWNNIVTKLIEDVVSISRDIKIQQIKEKFAGLRFYYASGNDNIEGYKEINKLIEEAETLSFKTCQHCGSLGSERNVRGWFVILCDKCEEKKKL